MFQFGISLLLILIGMLVGMGISGESLSNGVLNLSFPFYLVPDLTGIIIAIATGIYASMIVTRYQEVRAARDDAARAWAEVFSSAAFGEFSLSDPKVREVKKAIIDSRAKMAQYGQLKAYKIYDEVFGDIRKLNTFEGKHNDFKGNQQLVLAEFVFILRKLQTIRVDWMPILRLK